MTPGQNKKKTVFGAVSVEGRLYCSIQPSTRAVSFLAFVKQLLQRAAKAGHGVLLILDHYGIHTAKVVARFVAETEGRVQVVWLPSYCPNDNPQEKVWSHVQLIAWCSRHSFRIERCRALSGRRDEQWLGTPGLPIAGPGEGKLDPGRTGQLT